MKKQQPNSYIAVACDGEGQTTKAQWLAVVCNGNFFAVAMNWQFTETMIRRLVDCDYKGDDAICNNIG